MSSPNADPGFADLQVEAIAEVVAAHHPNTEPSREARRKAAVAVILRDRPEGGPEVLFIKRAEHPLDPWSGHMAFPGGHQDPEDETLCDTARRETREEINIHLTEADKIGRLHDLSGGRLTGSGMTVSPFVYSVPARIDVVLNPEVDAVVWIPLAFLGDLENVTPYIYPRDPTKRKFPSFQYEGYTVWGMTFRMVGHLLELFGIILPSEGPLTDVE